MLSFLTRLLSAAWLWLAGEIDDGAEPEVPCFLWTAPDLEEMVSGK